MVELCTRQLAASTGMARQVEHPGTMEPVAPGAVSWALHIGSGCWALHIRHGHEDWAQHQPGHNVCQHWHCTLVLGIASQTLHTLHQLQAHHWAALWVCLPSWTEPSCPASVPCLSPPWACLVPQQCRMVLWGAGSKPSQALSHHFLQALPARTTGGENLVSPLWLLAANWREVWYVFMPAREQCQLLPQAGAGQAVQPVSRTLLVGLGPWMQDVSALASLGQ